LNEKNGHSVHSIQSSFKNSKNSKNSLHLTASGMVSLDRASGFRLHWTEGASYGDALPDPQNCVFFEVVYGRNAREGKMVVNKVWAG
jgi:hypothetical protein